MNWPKRPIQWTEGDTLCISVPFTWFLPSVRKALSRPLLWPRVRVGGPAVDLMPDFLTGLPGVELGGDMPGVLQRVNPMATRTTRGCIRHCKFCAIGEGFVEPGGIQEISDWPDLPILADNNLLAASAAHFDRVMDRLEVWGWADFTQGVDSRLLNEHHAERFARLKGKHTQIRLALDSMAYADGWELAFSTLRKAKVPKSHIRSYALIGFDSGPDEAWARCEWLTAHGIKALPMWFHALDQLERNIVTEKQASLGWTDELRRGIMGWYYKHRGSKPQVVAA